MNQGMMSQMPSNDETKQHTEEVTKARASGRAPVAAVFEDDCAAGADQAGINEAREASLYSDNSMPQEFTFFQKKKRADKAFLDPSDSLRRPFFFSWTDPVEEIPWATLVSTGTIGAFSRA